MSSMFLKRINKEIQLYKKDNFSFPNLIIQPSDNIRTWYFIIHGLVDTDYTGGVFLGKVLLPEKYPLIACDFILLTPTGRFEIDRKLCTTFSGFHNDIYSPSWNICSMLTGLVSFMTDDTSDSASHGLGGIYNTTREDKLKIAKNSINYIKNHKPILDIFETYFKEYYEILGLN
jgi:ubiquitin-protein ligase